MKHEYKYKVELSKCGKFVNLFSETVYSDPKNKGWKHTKSYLNGIPIDKVKEVSEQMLKTGAISKEIDEEVKNNPK